MRLRPPGSFLLIIGLLTISLLGACGQKGPLYLPKPEQSAPAKPAAPAPASATLPQPATIPPPQ